MKAVEFEVEMRGTTALPIPSQVAPQIPQSGKAKVILLFPEDIEDAAWRSGAYEQFMKDDSPEDSVYDQYASAR
ncbi:MAG: hypothetical protein HY360_12135 [Verrucomicrobia bacterium]|nr:hypothetical protein [Verrucomicrobiota bacterium]